MKWGTPHSNRTFIEGKTTTRDDSTMTGQETEEPDAENEEGEEEEEEEEEGGVNAPK